MNSFRIITLLTFLFVYSQANAQGPVCKLSPSDKKESLKCNLRYESDNPDSLIIYKGYVVNFNKKWKIPNWTSYELSPADIDNSKEKAKRKPKFYKDQNALPVCYQADHGDYDNCGFDRGHLTPAGDQSWNQELKDETFFITNIAPQSPDLNEGIWEKLESGIRNLVHDSSITCSIITGSIMDSKKARGISKNKIGIPSAFYKIVYFNHKGVDHIYCFLIPHLFSYKEPDPSIYQTTLKEIETAANFSFLEKHPRKKILENNKSENLSWLKKH